MTIEQITDYLRKIQKDKDDDEVAHSLEDELYFLFIESIANGDISNLQEKAKLVLRTKELTFARWCA